MVVGADGDLPPAQRPDEWADQPGTRAPHVWVLVDDQKRSSLDLFQGGRLLLSEDDRWTAATARAAGKLGVPVTFVHIGTDENPREPNAFRTSYGVGTDGATLIRPDGYIAWRCPAAPGHPTLALTDTLRHVAFTAAHPANASAMSR